LKGSPAKVIFLLPLKELKVADPQTVHLGLNDVGDGRVAAAIAWFLADFLVSFYTLGTDSRLDLEGLFIMNVNQPQRNEVKSEPKLPLRMLDQ